MTTVVNCATYDAMDTRLMQIESSFTRGFAALQLIGNASEVCKDGKERARTALEALGIEIPPQRLIVSLTPADAKKDGSQFDLPLAISIAILVCQRNLSMQPKRWLFAAELGLNGELKPVRGSISFALAALANQLDGIVVAAENLKELSVLKQLHIPGFQRLKIQGFCHLGDVLNWIFTGDEAKLSTIDATCKAACATEHQLNFDDMILDSSLKKLALTVATGEHSLLLRGSPGTGKSMFATRLASILPPMQRGEHLEALRVRSAFSAQVPETLLAGRPPFRNPHHQASASAILGTHDRPGELSLAHGGVLFLDELPEFRRDILEGLREPLESGEVSVSRSRNKVVWKARALLIAACNNCPCGWFASTKKKCRCGVPQIVAYKHRLSGPVLDRIDLHYNISDLMDDDEAMFCGFTRDNKESVTEFMAKQVRAAREFSLKRNQKFGVLLNRDLSTLRLQEASGLSEREFLRGLENIKQHQLTKRSLIRTIRVARTLADLDASDKILEPHFRQAADWQAESSSRERGEHLMGF